MTTPELFGVFSISVVQGTTVTRLADLIPAGVDMESLFFSRKTQDAVYLGVRFALEDAAGQSISVAEALDGSYFFLVEDGLRDAWFTSPAALSLMVYPSSIVESVQEAKAAVLTIPLADFKNKNNQKPLLNKLDAVIATIQAGDYAGAQDKLVHDLLAKTDGCAASGAPDKNDWVEECDSQDELYPLILQTIDYLTILMN